MVGPRTKIVLLTWFFTFAFALLFLALVQNYAHASTPSLVPVHLVDSVITYSSVPGFWLGHQLSNFDFTTDDSYQKYLHTDHPFLDSAYVPTDLIPIDSNFTANDSQKFQLRQEAAIQFADMAWHFRNAFSGDRLYISSAWRSRGLQDYLIKQWCPLQRCAEIGTSEHQAGLAVDLKVITKWGKWYSLDVAYPNKYYNWLKVHAADYGFHNTYQKWIDIDGKIAEWRHRRYLWVELATILMQNNQTFAEYYKNLMNN